MIVYLIIFTVICVVLIKPQKSRNKFVHQKYAHRGFYKKDQSIKENSMKAFEEAVNRGYGIELDVQLNKDHEVVVYHDFNLTRLEEAEFNIKDLGLVDLRQYEICTLQEVLDLVQGKIELIVELKSDSNRNELCQKVTDILKYYNGPYCVESFDPRIVRWFNIHAAGFKRGQLIMPVGNYDNKLVGLFINSLLYNLWTKPNFLAVNVNSSQRNPMIKLCQLLGVQICLWTVHQHEQTSYFNADAYIFEHYEA